MPEVTTTPVVVKSVKDLPKDAAPLKAILPKNIDPKTARRHLRAARREKIGFTWHKLGSRWFFVPKEAAKARAYFKEHIAN